MEKEELEGLKDVSSLSSSFFDRLPLPRASSVRPAFGMAGYTLFFLEASLSIVERAPAASKLNDLLLLLLLPGSFPSFPFFFRRQALGQLFGTWD